MENQGGLVNQGLPGSFEILAFRGLPVFLCVSEASGRAGPGFRAREILYVLLWSEAVSIDASGGQALPYFNCGPIISVNNRI